MHCATYIIGLGVLHGKKAGVSIQKTLRHFVNIGWLHSYDGEYELSHSLLKKNY